MSSRSAFRPLTRAIAWLAVTAAALLATSFALSAPAVADETPPPDTTTEPDETTSTTQTPTEEPTDPAPTETPESTPGPTPTDASPSPTPEEKSQESDGVTAAVEPDFGYNKFRVGVRLADPSAAGGLTTLGSTIRITEELQDGSDEVTECTTTLEDPGEPTTTYCENLGPDIQGFGDYYWSAIGGGSTITVQQIGVNDGLVIVDGTKIVVPCGECQEQIGDVLLTDDVRSTGDDDDDGDDGDGDESDDEESDDPEDGALPNVGAPSPALLGIGAMLTAIGSRLMAGGRSRPRHRVGAR